MYNIHVCEAASLNLLNQFTFKMRQIFVISFEIEKKNLKFKKKNGPSSHETNKK
jgi:hypothetical protein